jgi:cobalt-zinc-cadmium efflux system outer membrane protein
MDQKLIVKLLPLEGLYRVGSELRLRSMIRNSFFAIAFSASSSSALLFAQNMDLPTFRANIVSVGGSSSIQATSAPEQSAVQQVSGLIAPLQNDTAAVTAPADPIVAPQGTSTEVTAQPNTVGWTLEALEQLALQNHPAIAQQTALIAAAQGNWQQVGLQANPSVGYEGQQLGSRGLAEQDGISIGQEFIRPGKLRLNREIASAEIQKARQDLAVIQQRIRTDIRIAYFDLLIAQHRIQIATQLQEIANQSTRAANQLLEAKEVGRADVLQATIEAENAQIVLQNASNRAVASWQALASLTGLPAYQPELVSGSFDFDPATFDFETVLSQLRSTSPEISAVVAEIETAQRTLARERFEPRPNVSVNGLVNYRDNGIGGGSDGGVAVALPLPLWNKNQGRIREAFYQLQASQHALTKLERDLQNRLAPAFERYANSKNQFQRYRESIIPAATESLELNKRAYTAGEVGFVEYLTAQRTYFQTSLNYLDSARELRVAESEIDGLLLQGSLQK